MFLETIGANEAVRRSFAASATPDLALARVVKNQRGQYSLVGEDFEAEAEVSGSLWYRAENAAALPVVGDWVGARPVGPNQAIVEIVLPRRSAFSRRAAGKRAEEQVVAANIDLAFLICGLDGDFNPRRMERYLALAAAGNVEPVIVLNKLDLCGEVEARMRAARAVAGAAPVLTTSAATGAGIENLRRHIVSGVTVALLGSSGAGKSSLINRLLGEERLRTGAVRKSDSRGRHTTTHRELIPFAGGGALIDSPGMRELQLWAESASVESVFDEIRGLAENCRFRDCTHTGEPGCAVEAGLHAGVLSAERWQSYRKLIREARHHEEMADELAAAARKKRDRQMHRALRQHPKFKR